VRYGTSECPASDGKEPPPWASSRITIHDQQGEDPLKNMRLRTAGLVAVATAGFATAALVGVAAAGTFTLNVAKNAKVVNQQGQSTHENIVVGRKTRAVYMLSGDSKSHPKCTAKNHCFSFWPPVTVASGKKPTKAAGIKGKLSVWKRNGFSQVLLSGHPLYNYSGDHKAAVATGEGVVSFGGTWHVVKADPSGGTTSTMSTGTTTTTPCVPFPGYPCA
jgi:predicted lipoprotein with Yx(FWY)xxD motif